MGCAATALVAAFAALERDGFDAAAAALLVVGVAGGDRGRGRRRARQLRAGLPRRPAWARRRRPAGTGADRMNPSTCASTASSTRRAPAGAISSPLAPRRGRRRLHADPVSRQGGGHAHLRRAGPRAQGGARRHARAAPRQRPRRRGARGRRPTASMSGRTTCTPPTRAGCSGRRRSSASPSRPRRRPTSSTACRSTTPASAACFATASKANPEPPIGLDGFARIAFRARLAGGKLPVGAIAGIDPTNAAAVIAAGADGVAVISAIFAADDVAAAARRLRAIVDQALAARGAL